MRRRALARAIPRRVRCGSEMVSSSSLNVPEGHHLLTQRALPAWIGRCLALTILVGAALEIGDAAAQPVIGRARWCVNLADIGGGILNCRYNSLEECIFYARGLSHQCALNPWYEEPVRRPARKK